MANPRFLLSIILLLVLISSVFSIPADSVGLERKGDKVYIVHRVETKETLFGISRRYKVPMSQILDVNPDAKKGLEIGQLILVPYVETIPLAKSGGIHVVKPSETLYFISKLYEVSVEDIKKWNNLVRNELNVGQKLRIIKEAQSKVKGDTNEGGNWHIVKAGETLFAVSRQYEVTIDQLRKWNDLNNNSISIGQRIKISGQTDVVERATDVKDVTKDVIKSPEKIVRPPEEVVKVGEKKDTEVVRTTSSSYVRKVEDGLAAMIQGSTENKKYLALHRTAEIGTIMQVRNEMNNRVVFVRVLGKLPDIGENDNILIRISKAAYERLRAIDQKFRVEISYVP